MEKSPEAIYDELLVLRCQDGEEAALDELVRRWQARLFRHALRMTHRQHAAWDVVQESWLAIVRGLNRLEDPASFPKWAYRIVTNKCADWTRRQQRRQRLMERAATDAEAKYESSEDPVAVVATQDDATHLRIALRGMSTDQQAVLSMCYLDGMSLREIAEVLNIPRGTVKSRLFHAREQLRHVLERIKT